ncbi:hypothetical protein NQZ79_g8175 [Umbelopsis isabellina]|nr:hypothetical protein NQZ79_g8175 [Umbelopsis isabellina]
MKLLSTSMALAAGAALTVASPVHKRDTAACNTTVSYATTSAEILVQNFNNSTGLWGDTSGFNGGTWWTSANMMEILVDLFDYVPSKKDEYMSVVESVWYGAQYYNLNYNNNTAGLAQLQQQPTPAVNGSFFDDYYDDEGWWAMAWIKVYDMTQDQRYLDAAINIFSDMITGYGVSSCGGVLWGKGQAYVSAISNELFLATAASLANRVNSTDKQYYLDWAAKEWTWFESSGLWNSNNTINDGLLDNCGNNGATVWSYNQGMIIGALVEYNKANPNSSLIDTAHTVAQAAINQLSVDGILHDACEPTCGDGTDDGQFKGIFIRNLSRLQAVSPMALYQSYIANNSASIWANDRGSDGIHGEIWSGPVTLPNMVSHSSALDCLVENIFVQGCTQ